APSIGTAASAAGSSPAARALPARGSTTAERRPAGTGRTRRGGPARGRPGRGTPPCTAHSERASALVEIEGRVQRAHRQLRVLLVDEAADLDLAGGDDAD